MNYTSIEQSKKLLELGLSPDSADMCYGYIALYNYSDRSYDGGYDEVPYPKDFMKLNSNFSEDEYDGTLPCWSLAALLDILPKGTNISTPRPLNALSYCCWNQYNEIYADNPVDACYEMIMHLHELNLL